MSVSNEGGFQRYLFEYKFGNAEWGIEIIAANPAEARERLKAISWAQYKGEIIGKIPVVPGPIVRALSRFRAALGI
ncbi:hypothetical protein [Bradyrhizobium sp. NBAIM01]|uniref:hypothetical protein n=1 Tax=Bradyrhizobium sp. NBAIM01 TaxID=2793818 RepID=UPI001CD69AAD|nr:hypothetical protein [Bradyrhizobium sp. NBAIM01]MCA1510515.1 hypothetical protein [Bradyrhizobium sp. NBAIM01]